MYGGIVGAIVFKLMQDALSSVTPEYWTFWLGLFLVVLVVVGRDRLLKPWTWRRRAGARRRDEAAGPVARESGAAPAVGKPARGAE